MKKFLFLVLMMPLQAMAQDGASLDVMCKTITNYQVADGVNYVPGADDVVPADLNPLNAAVPDVINIPIDVYLAERFQNVKIPDDLELLPTVSTIAVHKNGRVDYNGQDVSARAYSLCGKAVVATEEGGLKGAENDQAAVSTSEQSSKEDVDDGLRLKEGLLEQSVVNGQRGGDVLQSGAVEQNTPKTVEIKDGIEAEVLEGQYP